MNLGKRERGALMILLMALVALLADKFLLPPPADATATVAPRESGAPPEPPVSAPPPRAAPPAAAEAVRAPDVFAWSRLEGWAAAPAPSVNPAAETAPETEEFARRHRLQATILGPSPVARVGGRTLRVGDRLDGFTLEAIARDEAVFVSDTQQRVALRAASRTNKP